MSEQSHRVVSFPVICLLLLVVSSLAFQNPVSAHPPQALSLEYSIADQKLNVSITHVVADPATHYIVTVDISRNSIPALTVNYTSQPTADTFNYTYNVTAVDGDILGVTASCSLFGSLARQLTVSSAPPPEFIVPAVNITSPIPGQVFNTSNIQVSGTASDNVALSRVEVSLNNATWSNATGTTSWLAPLTLYLGPNFIRARAVDTSNNSAVDFVYVTYTNQTGPLDTTDPNITISYPLNGAVFNVTSITVRGNASDNVAVQRVDVKVNNDTWQIANGNLSYFATVTISNGTNTVSARASDTSGNTNITSILVVCHNTSTPPPPSNDTTPPSIVITSPADGAHFNRSNVNITGTASDNVAVSQIDVRVNRGQWRTATGHTSWVATVTVVNGTSQIDARATDTSNNAYEKSINVTYTAPPPSPPVDQTPPVVSITKPASGAFVMTPSFTVEGTASDDTEVASVEVRVNGGSWDAASGTAAWSLPVQLVFGENTLDARTTDTAGNTANASVKFTCFKNAKNPSLDGIINPGEYRYTATMASGDWVLHWVVQGSEIWMAIEGRTTGWVSIGLAPTVMMRNADVIMGWYSGGRAGMLDAYSPSETGDHPADTAMSPPGTSDIGEYGCRETGAVTTFEFRRALRTGDRYDNDIPSRGTLKFIWALGSDDNPSTRHSRAGYGTINITTGKSEQQQSTQWVPHALLMMTGLVLMIAGMSIAMARPQGWWLRGHRAIMSVGALTAVPGLLYGFYMISVSTGQHFRVPHTLIGGLCLALAVVTPLIGTRSLALGKKGRHLRMPHRWLGRITILMMVVTVISGLIQAGVLR